MTQVKSSLHGKRVIKTPNVDLISISGLVLQSLDPSIHKYFIFCVLIRLILHTSYAQCFVNENPVNETKLTANHLKNETKLTAKHLKNVTKLTA